MTDETGSPAVQEAVALPADAPEAFDSPSDAAAYFTELRSKPPKEKPAESADEPATAEQESAPQEQDSAPETDPAETEEAEPDESPPIERPRSWAKDDDDEWNALPRARQEKIAANERARELDIRQRTNELAEDRKAAKAEREAAEAARKQYETAKLDTVATLEREQQRDFPDIRTMDDVRTLQRNDPFRFQEWQIHQMSLTAAVAEKQQIEGRQAQEKQGKRATYEAEQNKLLAELVPEMADPKKASQLRERAVAMLTDDLGLKNEQLSRWMADDTGHEILSNAGIQKLIADGLKYRDIQSAPKAVAAKTLPPVQRPGTSKPSASSASERIQTLTRQLNETGDLSIAQELRTLQMRRA